MATYFQGRRVKRASNFTQAMTWAQTSVNAYQITLSAAPSGCIARLYMPLWVSNGSTGDLGLGYANWNGSGYVNRGSANGLVFFQNTGTYYRSGGIFSSNQGSERAAVVGDLGNMTAVYNAGVIPQAWGLVGIVLLPEERPYVSCVSVFGSPSGTTTFGLWEIY